MYTKKGAQPLKARERRPEGIELGGFVRLEARLLELRALAYHLNKLNRKILAGYVAPVEPIPPGVPKHIADELRKTQRRFRKKFLKELRAAQEAWQTAQAIIEECLARPPTEPLPAQAIRRFNTLAAGTPFVYFFRSTEEPVSELPPSLPWRKDHVVSLPEREIMVNWRWVTRGQLLSPNWHAHVVLLLRNFFLNSARNRLKHCPQCGRWFVDESRNGSTIRCSIRCTNAWWNRARRRAANHSQYRRKMRETEGEGQAMLSRELKGRGSLLG